MGVEKEDRAQSDALLQTKLFMPAPRDDLIRRKRLIDLLQSDLLQQNDAFNRKLTLITAPAGYGKTTLACQWLAGSKIPVAWLTLEPSENDPVRFLMYLVAAFQVVSTRIGSRVQTMLQAPQRTPQEILLTTLINELTDHEGSLLMVMDDYHVIQSKSNHDALNFLVEHLPTNIHLVVTSREDPPLPLHRLQARRQMLGVRQADLSFLIDEVIDFFRANSSFDLSLEQAELLARRTEGWITGLQLAALSMRTAPDRDSFIESFTGSNRYILDYLFEEVFETQPDEVKSFLLKTSILNRVCADLANRVTGQSDSQEVLERLEGTNFFIVPLDQKREWYRYHRLFVDLLRHRSRKISLNLASLHERAGRWYAEHGHLEEAIEHALSGKHWNLAGEWIDRASELTLRRGEVLTLLNWCKRMPEDVLLGRPDWALDYVWPLILIGETEEAERVLQRIQHDLPAESDELQGQIASAEAFLSRMSGDMEKTVELSKKALSLLPDDDRMSRGSIAVNLGLITWHLGQLDEAEDSLREALVDTRATGNQYAEHTAQVFLARTLASRGELASAADRLARALAMGDQMPTAVLAHTDMAAIHFERNEIDSAWEHMGKASEVADAIHNLEFQTACSVQLALMHLGMYEVEAAKTALEGALAISRRQELPILTAARIQSCQVQVALAEGNLHDARRIHANIPLQHDAHTFCRFIDLNWARIHLAAGETSKARDVLAVAYRQASLSGWVYALHSIRVLQALAENDPEQAQEHIAPVLRTAEVEGYFRIFIQEGSGTVPALKEAARLGFSPDFIGKILAAIEGSMPQVQRTDALPEQLTEREMEVLHLLAAGLSNRQIAEQLVVSLGTVKSHIHHIFGKLEVSSRTEAAARARDIGLI